MGKTSILADALKAINNAERSGAKQVLIKPISKIIIKFLSIMMKYEYIQSFQIIDDQRSGKIVVNLSGRINKCGCIMPRYNLRLSNIKKFRNKCMPSKVFGILVLTTSKGVLDHKKAIKKRSSGKILGFFY